MTLALVPEPPAAGWMRAVPTSIARPLAGGLALIVVFVAGFGLWAATAPLSGAVIARGAVKASGQNQVVEHLEGGIISEIHVAEGDLVEKGQVLLALDRTRVLAESNRVRTAILLAEAQLTRARVELTDGERMEYSPDQIAAAREHGLGDELEEQRAEFSNRLLRHRSELAALEQRANAVREEIEGLRIQRNAEETNLAILREELGEKKTLLDQGLTQRAGYNALRRAETEALARMGTLTAAIGQKRAEIAELTDERATMQATRRERAASEINDLRSRIGDLREQQRTRSDTLARLDIRAPTRGVIVSLLANTIGSTIQPGEKVVEILPAGSDLIIEIRVPPNDVDAVVVGQEAQVRLTALNARTTPSVPASVIYLSADRLVDAKTQEPYYTARLAFGPFPPGVSQEQIFPGMPVDVLINTGDRTFLEYLVQPIEESLSRAFREE